MSDPLDFSGKRVLVIGGSSGIGNGIAQAFRSRGAEAHVTGTRHDEGDYLENEDCDFTGLTYHQLDVTDRDAVDQLAGGVGAMDIVVCCQGAVRYGRQEFERAGWDLVVDVNLNSVMDCARAFHPGLAERDGSLIIVSSTGAFHAMIGNPAYGASKAGAASLVGSLAQAWARDGIRVNGIAPGFVATKMTRVTTENEKRRAGVIERVPLSRMGTPEDMAGAALFLASPLAAYITGQSLIVDGGLSL
ncbi:SDR family oxidoreductase [Altererythrobacter arenosus]|uniref:SDR family oxidoreductase n=1 Tax=Altererythrobacter arenosus TaxID=3032592 RepID=A0ABY8FS73_9SPHN|nr:SDR family oxidoreductase [Altererythrobacter sp. CAU 1644]WFL77862.1 SDR family oxidoreductase [Altererythrobacter sp. CAU 1644]